MVYHLSKSSQCGLGCYFLTLNLGCSTLGSFYPPPICVRCLQCSATIQWSMPYTEGVEWQPCFGEMVTSS